MSHTKTDSGLDLTSELLFVNTRDRIPMLSSKQLQLYMGNYLSFLLNDGLKTKETTWGEPEKEAGGGSCALRRRGVGTFESSRFLC